MRRWFSSLLVCLIAAAGTSAPPRVAAQGLDGFDPPRQTSDGRVRIAGRTVKCPNVRTEFDRSLDNVGMAALGDALVVLNPLYLRAYSPTVQLFVFHHECGHHVVGESELEADCWAVREGVRAGWLERNGLAQVCRSFDNAPETDTHPSGRRRCANLDRCYAAAETETIAARRREQTEASRLARRPVEQPKQAAVAMPRLVSGPQLMWSGRR